MPQPIVRLVEPASSLPIDHHGPPQSGKAALSSTTSSPAPRYFRNPWPSYRMPGWQDTYTAFQKGAAIARPPSISVKHFDDPSDLTAFEEEEYIDLGITRTASGYFFPGTYIPLDMRKIHREDEKDDWREPPVRVVDPTWDESLDDKANVTWLGHAGAMIRLPWKKGKGRRGMCGILFDPIFSYRCSPSQYVGPARYLDPPCKVSELPEIHLCFISHDHYDHLDYYTILDLWKYNRDSIHFVVPLGLKQWFEGCSIRSERITELDWWHEAIISIPADLGAQPYDPVEAEASSSNAGDSNAALTLKVACTPSQHRSGRALLDHMKTLWASWCVGVVDEENVARMNERGMQDWKGFKMFFGGDTGYRYATAAEGDTYAVCPAFRDIAHHYSPFTFALLPLSTGSSLPFLRSLLSLSLDQYTLTSSNHCSPADSMEIHRIIQSERTLGMHWGTFCDADEARGTRVEFGRVRRNMGIGKIWEDPPKEVEEKGSSNDGRNGRFVVADIGETLIFP